MPYRSLFVVLLITAAASAQSPAPVDQAVADLDLLGTSLRRIETGLRQDGEQTSLYTLDPATAGALTGRDLGTVTATPVYLRVGPGFAASINQIDYLVRSDDPSQPKKIDLNVAPRRDGEFIELVPPNTVYLLSPVDEQRYNPPAAEPVNPHRMDYRIDGRVDGRIDSRLDNRVNNQVGYGRPQHAIPAYTGRFSVNSRPVNSMLSIRRTFRKRPATKATKPPVKQGSTESN